jgi:hypothetical protein
MTADLDPTEVKEHINNHPLKHLDKMGVDSGNPVDTIKGDVHIERTFGDRYQWREGVDFKYGLNATYNFGQQYIENHADDLLDATQAYNIPGLDTVESSAAGNVDDAVQAGLSDERKAGLVTKNFGNQYKYDQGITRTWAKGPGACVEHVTLNFGGRYIENQLTATSGEQDTSGLNGLVSDTTLAIKTVGDEARYNKGVIDIHHEGDMKHVQTGSVTSEITGDQDTKIVSGTATVEESISGGAVSKTIMGASEDTLEKTITGDITETITTAGKMAITITAATEYNKMITAPIAKETVTGNFDWIKSAQNQTVLGICTDNFFGMKSSFLGAIVQESFGGVKIATHSGALIENKQGRIGKNQMSIEDVKSVCMDKSLTRIQKANLIMIG